MSQNSSDEQALAEISAGADGDLRHHRLRDFVAVRPSSGLGHLHLGLSYLLNRFSPTLDLPLSVIVLGGPVRAPRTMVQDHLESAEEHFNRAMVLDVGLTADATCNLAAGKVCRHRYGPAIVYIEDLLKMSDHPRTAVLSSYLGIAYREMGEYETALRIFHALLGSTLQFVRRHLALAYLARAEPTNALRELEQQLQLADSEIDRLLANAVAFEVAESVDDAVRTYREIAARWRFDGQHEITGLNAARRARTLAGDDEVPGDDCDELSY